jgi:hypothetical protein
VRELIREHLRGAIGLLVGFVLASAAVVFADAPAWARVLAAVLAVLALSLVVAWLQVPWAEWRARRARRLVLVTAPMVAAVLVLLLGVLVPRGESAVFSDPATLILLDASGRMLEPLTPGQPKFDEASQELRRQVRDLGNDQLGLATFGVASCDSDETFEKRVSIAHDRAKRIRDEAGELRPEGRANLVSAARSALSLLNPFTDERRRLLLITAGLDGCGGKLKELVEESKFKKVVVQWELIGLGLTAAETGEVEALSGDVRVHLVETGAELEGALRTVFFEEPIRDEMDSALGYVQTDIREPLNAAIAAINVRPPQARVARAKLSELRRLAKDGAERFDDFATEDERSVFLPVKRLLRQQFELLKGAAAAADDVVGFDQRHGGELSQGRLVERNALIGRLNEPIGAYNANLSRLEEQIEHALDDLFGAR